MRAPDWESGGVKFYCGDVFAVLRELPPQSVHCCVTSPPYWALRSYLKPGDPLKAMELGSEKTPDEHVERMVAVFEEVKRVLRDDGLLWVNYGDSYDSGTRATRDCSMTTKHGYWNNPAINLRCKAGLGGLQRVGIPERFALAMQSSGWIWRDTIVWHKKSPMPASLSGTAWVRCRVKVSGHQRDVGYSNATEGRPQSDSRHTGPYQDARYIDCPGCPKCRDTGGYVLRRGSWRTTPAHEYIFMFAKKAGYFADQEAVKQDCAVESTKRAAYGFKPAAGYDANHFGDGYMRNNGEPVDFGGKCNPRSVMSFKQVPLKEKHYAAFPPGLPEFCIKASTSEKGVCPTCGAQWARVLGRKTFTPTRTSCKSGNGPKGVDESMGWDREPCGIVSSETIAWRPTCSCPPAEPVPATVLDPFAGAATTLLVAERLGRNSIGIELNPEYLTIAQRRISVESERFPLLLTPGQ